VNKQATKVATVQNVTITQAIESVWLALESGLLRFANSDDHFWIEPCGSEPAERRAARKATLRLIKCRKLMAPARNTGPEFHPARAE
jgi:hypothetical protein